MKNQAKKTNEEMYNELYEYCETKARAISLVPEDQREKSLLRYERVLTDQDDDKIKQIFDIGNRTSQDLISLYDFMHGSFVDREFKQAEKEDTKNFKKSHIVDDIISTINDIVYDTLQEKYHDAFKDWMGGDY